MMNKETDVRLSHISKERKAQNRLLLSLIKVGTTLFFKHRFSIFFLFLPPSSSTCFSFFFLPFSEQTSPRLPVRPFVVLPKFGSRSKIPFSRATPMYAAEPINPAYVIGPTLMPPLLLTAAEEGERGNGEKRRGICIERH